MTSSLSPGGTTSVSRSVTNPYWYSRLASSATSLGTPVIACRPLLPARPVISRPVIVEACDVEACDVEGASWSSPCCRHPLTPTGSGS